MSEETKEPLYKVVAIEFATGKERIMAENKTLKNAAAFVSMAIARRGVETEFYRTDLQ